MLKKEMPGFEGRRSLRVEGRDATSTNAHPSHSTDAAYNGRGVATLLGLGSLVRYQEPPIKKTKGKDPQWYIRPYIDVLRRDGTLERERRRFYLGSVASTKRDEAQAKRRKALGIVNNGRHVLQA